MANLCCVISTADVPYIDNFISAYLPHDITLTAYIEKSELIFMERLQSTILFQVLGNNLTWCYAAQHQQDIWESTLAESIPVPIEFFQNPSAFPELLVLL